LSKGQVPTGVDGLDQLIEGGFQRGSLILLAGNTGTGKTVFGAKFLCKGVDLGETGVYVSFAEDSVLSTVMCQVFEVYVGWV